MESSVQHDERVMDLLADTLQQAPEERERYLDAVCKGDTELRSEVAEALDWENRMGSFLLNPWLEFTKLTNPFTAGEMVEDRFEIVREIGEGGMGVVYEALDRKRHLKIAIKAAKPGFQRLLTPELEGALKVRHHNICLVNQIHTAQTKYGEIDFLSMEFLDGETLADYLETHGKMSEPEALPIARQLCAGISEAHRSGVIHRDLKSANIILCREEDGNLRAVVTDFGLAGIDGESNVLAGTPRYIAPEIWDGKPASRASDIYALGVILCELVKGPEIQWRVSPDGISETLPPAEEMVQGLSARWSRTILRCLEASPESRPKDAAEVLAGLEGRPSRLLPLLLIPVLASAAFVSPRVRAWAHDLIWPPPSLRLVVLPTTGSDAKAVASGGVLQDVSSRLAHLQSGSQSVTVIPPGTAEDVGATTPEQAKKVLHATHALETQTSKEGQDTVVRGSVIDLDTQTHVRDFSYRYTPTTVGALAGALAGEVSTDLRLQGTATAEALSPVATQPYDRGLYLLQQAHSPQEAIPFFQQAARVDPRSPLPLAALVEAEATGFEDTKDASYLNAAQQHLQTAESLNPDSISVHLAAAKLYESNGKFAKALDEYLRVKSLAPANVDASVRLGMIYHKLDMPDKAIMEYRRAIELDPNSYEPYEWFGVFYYYRGDYSEAAKQFQKVIELAPGIYRAYSNLAMCLENLGRYQEAEQVFQRALQLHSSPDVLNNIGTLLSVEHRDADAVKYYQQAVSLKPGEYVYSVNLGDANRRLGRTKLAKDEYRRGLELVWAELRQNPAAGSARAHAAYFSARLGDRSGAELEIREALQSGAGDSEVTMRAAIIYVVLGDPDQALNILRTAPPEVLRTLDREPDMADFRQDPRFRELLQQTSNGGK